MMQISHDVPRLAYGPLFNLPQVRQVELLGVQDCTYVFALIFSELNQLRYSVNSITCHNF